METIHQKLVLFDKDNKELIYIENPSLKMIISIKKKCASAKVHYNNKRFVFYLLISSGVYLAICVLLMFAKQNT